MRALILTDGEANGSPNAGDAGPRIASNLCFALGITPNFQRATADYPTVAGLNGDIQAGTFDLVIIPKYAGVSDSRYSRLVDGSVNAPVFVLQTQNAGGIQGVDGYYDASTIFTTAKLSRTGQAFAVHARRYNLDTSLVLPEKSEPIISSLTEGDDVVSAWAYTNGTNWVFCGAGQNNFGRNFILPLFQKAIDVGAMQKPVSRVPFFLDIDHGNDAGRVEAEGGIGGWQENPEALKWVSDAVYAVGGSLRTSIEAEWSDGSKTNADAANSLSYDPAKEARLYDVLREAQLRGSFTIMPYHNHRDPLTTSVSSELSPINSQETKSRIDTVCIEDTLVEISRRGLSVDWEYGHFAGNQVGSNFWELASPEQSSMADPDGASKKIGYGCQVGRLGAVNTSWPIDTINPSPAQVGFHFASQEVRYRSISMVESSDPRTRTQYTVDITAITPGASSTVITTDDPHTQYVGSACYISGTSTNLDGWHTASAVTPNTITVDVVANGTTPAGTVTELAASVYQEFASWMQCLNTGQVQITHGWNWEDVEWRNQNLSSAPTTDSAGQMNVTPARACFLFMKNYCEATPDVSDFLPPISRYFKTRGGVGVAKGAGLVVGAS